MRRLNFHGRWLRFSASRAAGRKRRLGFELFEMRLPLAALPGGFVETTAASGLSAAAAMEIAPDGC